MEFVPVISSSIERVGYDEAARRLHVIFKRGEHHYVYGGVPPRIYLELLASPSKGRFVQRYLRNGPYSCRRLD